MSEDQVALIRSTIRDVPDFPKPGILFKDITPLLARTEAFVACLGLFHERFRPLRPDVIVGIESRGFIFGAALAARMGVAFAPARKPGKLPAKTDRVEYELEYGSDAVEMHVDAIPSSGKVVIIDDLIATGGTVGATKTLIERQTGIVVGAGFVIELEALKGRAKLGDLEPYSILTY